jgi:hypothetical protein
MMNAARIVVLLIELAIVLYFLPRVIRFAIRVAIYAYAGYWLLMLGMVAVLIVSSCINQHPAAPSSTVAHHLRQ